MAMQKLTRRDYESWGVSELITQIEELTYLINEADELLAPYEENNPELEEWRKRRDMYVS